jgi:hypothetical protein
MDFYSEEVYFELLINTVGYISPVKCFIALESQDRCFDTTR